MAGKLITLPLRVSFASARLLTRVATGAAGRALSLAGRTVGIVTPDRSTPQRPPADEPARERRDGRSPARDAEATAQAVPDVEATAQAVRDVQETPRSDPRAQPPGRPRVEEPPTRSVAPVPPVSPPQPSPAFAPEGPVTEEPVHVSEEPELVREEAEPGAEDGAGASITVMEPWNGYARMSARDVIARARSANPAELAAVRLYESRHRSRQTVLAAVDRQLKLANGGQPA